MGQKGDDADCDDKPGLVTDKVDSEFVMDNDNSGLVVDKDDWVRHGQR